MPTNAGRAGRDGPSVLPDRAIGSSRSWPTCDAATRPSLSRHGRASAHQHGQPSPCGTPGQLVRAMCLLPTAIRASPTPSRRRPRRSPARGPGPVHIPSASAPVVRRLRQTRARALAGRRVLLQRGMSALREAGVTGGPASRPWRGRHLQRLVAPERRDGQHRSTDVLQLRPKGTGTVVYRDGTQETYQLDAGAWSDLTPGKGKDVVLTTMANQHGPAGGLGGPVPRLRPLRERAAGSDQGGRGGDPAVHGLA